MSGTILALDQGTTSSRAILFDRAGLAVKTAQREFEQLFPQPGWVEHDPEAIWASQLAVAQEVMDGVQDVRALGITNQRETTLIWDRRSGRPIHNAIVWQDRRTAGFCDGLRAEGLQPEVQRRTGLVIDAYFSASKIRWLLDQVPGARADAEAGHLAFGTIDSWLIWKLTGGRVHVTDVSNASRTMLFNLSEDAWDPWLLDRLDIPAALLPEVRGSSEIVGETNSGLFGQALPIAGIGGDQQAALFGQTCFEVGAAKNTYGTGCFLLMNVGERPRPSNHRLLSTAGWRRAEDQRTYALEGSVFIGGAVVQWLRDGLGLFASSHEVEDLAASVEDNGGVYLVPAFAGLGAPHWDQYARGLMVGMTRGTTKAHVARAALEGIAYQVADVAEAMKADASTELTELRVDGGAAANDLLMQFQSDILQVPVVRPKVIETTALGAAYLAGLAVGFWRDLDDVRANFAVDRSFEPLMKAEEARRLRGRWSEALKRARGWEPIDQEGA
ncbi:MAG: glycerol kinase GlpK [Myxococcota bacterium]